MPTGYTHKIADGTETTLRQFALRCARGMGALVTMRDDPPDAPIPTVLTPDTKYHDKAMIEAGAAINDLRGMPPFQVAEAAEQDHDRRLTEWRERQDEDKAKYQRYTAMMDALEQVDSLPDGLKDFMLRQLEESRKFDCSYPNAHQFDPEPQPVSAEQWLAAQIEKHVSNLAYHAKKSREEIDRTAERNAWLAQLHTALKEIPE